LEINKLNKNYLIKKLDQETINLKILYNDTLLALSGTFNSNLKDIENITGTSIYSRGNSLTVKGDKNKINLVVEGIEELINQFNLTKNIDKNDVNLIINKFMDFNNNNNVRNLGAIIKSPKKSVIAKSTRQADYINSLRENLITFGLGPAGTGKSFLAVAVGIEMLTQKKIEKLILSRPAVEAGEKLGFLPGDMKEKVDPYLRPLYDALYELAGFEVIEKKINSGEIEIAPLAFMRGRTLKNSFAILDEAQNATETQIKMFLTRIGENTKLVVNGDPSQIDLINKNYSGLTKSKKILSKLKEIKMITFDHTDVIRHPIVSKIIQAYQNENND
jgi:phosphate starvation-inducible PhoH-like protein